MFFSLIVNLVTFNTNNERHFLTYMLTRLSNFTFPSFNFSMFSEKDSTTINNEGKK